jgi:hypothetical protein
LRVDNIKNSVNPAATLVRNSITRCIKRQVNFKCIIPDFITDHRRIADAWVGLNKGNRFLECQWYTSVGKKVRTPARINGNGSIGIELGPIRIAITVQLERNAVSSGIRCAPGWSEIDITHLSPCDVFCERGKRNEK